MAISCKAWNSPAEYPSWVVRCDIKGSVSTVLNPIFSKKVQGQKHPGRWGIVNWIIRNKFQWNFNQNATIFIEKNDIEYVIFFYENTKYLVSKCYLKQIPKVTILVVTQASAVEYVVCKMTIIYQHQFFKVFLWFLATSNWTGLLCQRRQCIVSNTSKPSPEQRWWLTVETVPSHSLP